MKSVARSALGRVESFRPESGDQSSDEIYSIKGDDTMLYLPHEEGQGLVEYALILALVALLVIVALRFLGNTVANTYNNIGNAMSGM